MTKYTTDVRLKQQGSRAIRPTQIIYHSLGNNYNFEGGLNWLLDPNNPLESHIAVRQDGHRVQLVPYAQRAEANYTANGPRADGSGALSVETDSSIGANEPWSADQVASIIEWTVERCREFNIPARLCPGPDAPGLGWHIMWGSPGVWTPSAKVCPGPARIEQVKNVIVPAVAAILKGEATGAGAGTEATDPKATDIAIGVDHDLARSPQGPHLRPVAGRCRHRRSQPSCLGCHQLSDRQGVGEGHRAGLRGVGEQRQPRHELRQEQAEEVTIPGAVTQPVTRSNQSSEKYLTAQEVSDLHRNADTDKTPTSIHHTLGGSRNQAASGDHIHDGGSSGYLWDGAQVTGSRTTGAAITSLLAILATQGLKDGTSA